MIMSTKCSDAIVCFEVPEFDGKVGGGRGELGEQLSLQMRNQRVQENRSS